VISSAHVQAWDHRATLEGTNVQSGEHEFAIGIRNGSSYETIDTSRDDASSLRIRRQGSTNVETGKAPFVRSGRLTAVVEAMRVGSS
jgi:hypothetical protein